MRFSNLHNIILVMGIVSLLPIFTYADTIILRDEVYVKGPQVTLGDIAEVKGDDAEFLKTIEITPAALPGGTRRIDAALMMSKIRSAGVDFSNIEVKGVKRVTARTLHLDITEGMIAEDLRRFIHREMPWDPEPTTVDVTAPARRYMVPDGDVEFHWKPNPQYAYLGPGSFRGEIHVDGKLEKTFYAKANIETYDQVLVANRSIARGESFSNENTRLEMRALTSVKKGAFFSMTDLQGKLAKSSIFQGQVITPRKVVSRKIVKRGQIIPVETTIGTLTIRAQGQAKSDGAAGDWIVCRNPETKEEFTGVLTKDGVLIVE